MYNKLLCTVIIQLKDFVKNVSLTLISTKVDSFISHLIKKMNYEI